jgi:hypothetical protein
MRSPQTLRFNYSIACLFERAALVIGLEPARRNGSRYNFSPKRPVACDNDIASRREERGAVQMFSFATFRMVRLGWIARSSYQNCVSQLFPLTLVALFLTVPGGAQTTPWFYSYQAGHIDPNGNFVGGTEVRSLVPHNGSLYAAIGYAEDVPGPAGPQTGQVLRLDTPTGEWVQDHKFPTGVNEVESMNELHLTKNGAGDPINARFLVVGLNNTLCSPAPCVDNASHIASYISLRADTTGNWLTYTVENPLITSNFTSGEVRAFGYHNDNSSSPNKGLIFVGERPGGVFSTYISGGELAPFTNELHLPANLGPPFTTPPFVQPTGIAPSGGPWTTWPKNLQLRPMAFAECNGAMYVSIGLQIYKRNDGATPSWSVLNNEYLSQTTFSMAGYRGLTCVPTASGGSTLLSSIDGDKPLLVEIDPTTGFETKELDLMAFVEQQWGMAPLGPESAFAMNEFDQFGQDFLFGVETKIPATTTLAPGFQVNPGGYEYSAWYIDRASFGSGFSIHQVPQLSSQSMVVPRSIKPSPFSDAQLTVYFGGFDVDSHPYHNTAWVVGCSSLSLCE